MYNLSVNGNGVNFKDLEKKIYKYACEQACKMMTEILEHLDKMLLEKRDKKAFRSKVFKHTCIKTIMGTVEIDRRVYEYVDENGKKSYRYLLDEYLEMETIGHMSANLVEKMVENATKIDLRIGIIEYRDITVDGVNSTRVHKLKGSTWHYSTADMIDSLAKLSVGGGGDTSETVIDGLGYLVDDANTMLWSSQSYKFAIVLTEMQILK